MIGGDDEIICDYIHIVDVANVLVALSQVSLTNSCRTFNIGSGEIISLNGIVAEIKHYLGRAVTVQKQPPRSFDLPVNVLDILRARATLDWSPTLPSIEGIRTCIGDVRAKAPRHYFKRLVRPHLLRNKDSHCIEPRVRTRRLGQGLRLVASMRLQMLDRARLAAYRDVGKTNI